MLTGPELSLISEWLPQLLGIEVPGPSAHFVVLDLRGELSVYETYRREWAEGRFRCQPLDAATDQPAQVAGRLAAMKLPVVIVRPEDVASSADLLSLLYAELVPCPILTLTERDGLLYHLDVRLTTRVETPSRITMGRPTLEILAARTHRYDGVALPKSVEVAVGQHPARRFIGFRAECPGTAMPEPAWFLLSGPARGTLVVDVQPGGARDIWQVTYAGCTDGVQPVTPPADRRGGLPDRLAVILDRTCVDRDRWSDTVLALRGQHAAGAGLGWARTVEDAAPAREPRDYNGEVRTALSRALAKVLAGSTTEIEGWWFADEPSSGLLMPPLPGLALPPTTSGWLGRRTASNVRGLFDAATWVPGLDVWDPLEEALEKAVESIEDADVRGGVLLVGNSPPTAPASPESPLRRIASVLGHPTSFRRKSPLWHDMIERCADLEIPMTYLFLVHDDHATQLQREFEIFSAVQTEVQRALASYLHLIVRPATSKGIFDGIRAALSFMSEATPASGVQVLL